VFPMTYLTGKSSLMFSAHVSDFMDCPEAPTPLLLAIRLDSSIAWIGIAIDISEGLPVGINDPRLWLQRSMVAGNGAFTS